MGMMRLLLAIAVVLSHADLRVLQLNPGVTAVVGFYLISGYVMAGLVHRHYNEPARIPYFYLDRLLRLYPQYLVYAGAALAWHLWTQTPTLFLRHAPTWPDIANNLLIVPLNFYMFNGSDAYALVPPGWSLGAELQFYLLAPAMLLWPRVGLVLAAASLLVHGLALHGVIHTDWYGYRLLPGILWVFGVGMLLYHWHRSRPRLALWLAWGAPLAALALYGYLRLRGLHAQPYHQEVILGWAIAIPAVHWLATRRLGAWDDLAGDLSYGVFLNHFLLIWLLFPQPGHTPLQWLVLLLCSLVLSYMTQRLVEKPVLAWRRHLRKPAA